MSMNLIKGLITTTLILGTAASIWAQTPVSKHGALTTSGPYLLNKNGNIVQLKGMSFYWSRPDWPGYSYYNASNLNFLVDSWKCTVVRVSYAPGQGWDGCQAVIDAAIAKGIYVIIDWHSHQAQTEESSAISFFREKATQYKNTPNVIFEPYNEPITAGGANGGTLTDAQLTWGAIKGYLKNVTQAIRDAGANNLVILGTPYYSQYVNVAAADQIKDNSGNLFKNVAYAFHFYAASHGPDAYYVQSEGGGMEATYLDGGLGKVPVFITEWGTTHSNGGQDGKNYIDQTNTNWWFTNYVNGDYHLSHCNWSVSSHETSSCFSGGTSPSQSGTIAMNLIKASSVDEWEPPSKSGTVGPSKDSTFNMPANHAASGYNRYYGSGIKAATVSFLNRDGADVRTAKNTSLSITNMGAENWVSYKFNVTSQTKYLVLRALSTDGGGTIEVYLDGTKKGDIVVAQKTTWTTLVSDLTVTTGQHEIQLKFLNTSGSGYSIEWIELSNSSVSISPQFRINNADPQLFINTTGFKVHLPLLHGFKAYSLMTANGRVVRSGSISRVTSELNFKNLSNGMWLLKLENINGAKLFKTIVSGN